MSDSVGVALAGYGFVGKTFHAPLIAATPGLRLAAALSSRPDDVHRDLPGVAVKTFDAALEDAGVQLIVLATPNDTHFDLARRALLAGKHVVVDKPFTTTLAEAEELAAVAARSGLVLSVFQNRRWDADFLTLRQVIARGELGEIVHFESHYDRYRPVVANRWRERPGPGSGVWFDLGSHLADQALQLFGHPQAIFADLAVQRTGGRATDYFHVLLRYPRLRVVLHGSSLVAEPPRRYELHGEKGSYIKSGIDTQEEALRRFETPGGDGWGIDPIEGVVWTGETSECRPFPNRRGNWIAFYEAVRDAIRGETANSVPPEQGVAVMKLLELACRSSAERREIEF